MPIQDFIITVFCLIDDECKKISGGHRLRARGFEPKLSDSEVITMDVVGEFLGKDTDTGIWRYFKEHWFSWFPELGSRGNYAKQSANLWIIKQRIHATFAAQNGALSDRLHMAWFANAYLPF